MREPAVAGEFYPSEPGELLRAIELSFLHPIGPGRVPVLSERREGRILGGVVPHAGYIYSGPVAAHFYAELAMDGFPETFIIIGPNHTGMGSLVSITMEDFRTPLGVARVDKEIARAIHRDIVDLDSDAHAYEHSLEVQIPFLQFFRRDVRIVPIVMMAQEYDFALELSKIIKDAITGRDVVIIASSDFSHYVPREIAYERDMKGIERILEGDVKGFYEALRRYNITACGYGPIATMLLATGGRARLLKYATSGDVFRMNDVVGYASIAVER
ncbi:MAG: MEMO1 family protein [Thermoplasmata archaeon]|jgi:AmmeMemoRadiSam system protein B|nr:MEMO1 family protein [Thermoplasmatales archaeon]PMP73256.1 MAG: MEMO1 family protein [Aciduliprofundum sp.]HEU13205.1 MEMO1 family protein [Euryarchaeota archaeon]